MSFDKRIFLWLSILCEACNPLFMHKLLSWLLENLCCIIVRLHALEPLEKFMVIFCYLVKSIYSDAVVQHWHYLEGWIVELTIFGWWLKIPLCSRLKCASACIASVECRTGCAQGGLIIEPISELNVDPFSELECTHIVHFVAVASSSPLIVKDPGIDILSRLPIFHMSIVVHFENLPYHRFTGKTIGKNNKLVKILVKFSKQKDSEIFSVL